MLRRLAIRNLTVFEDIEVELGPGLSVLSGETGAGKTMLLQALALVGGAKADPALIGPAADQAYVEAAFDDPAPAALADVAAGEEELVLARRLRKGGPARALCDGRSCSASQLSEAADGLIALTGQHAARRLVSPAFQLDLLDASAGLEPKRGKLAEAFAELRSAAAELESLRTSMLDRQRRLEMLRHEQQLFEQVDPQPGELAELEAAKSRLEHAELLAGTVAGLHDGLSAADGSIVERLDLLEADARRGGEHDARLDEVANVLLDARETLADAAERARGLSEDYSSDPERLDELQERIISIGDLKRRFGGAEIDQIREQIEAGLGEIAELEEGDAAIERLESKLAAARAVYDKQAKALSKARRKAAGDLRRKVEKHLADLALPEATLEVNFSEAKVSARGIDAVEFLLAANRGLEPAPLASGASGGELSRVNLALLLATSSGTGTYVFDEVDAGIGGQTAHAVAAKLAALAESAQVIVISHLHQIAIRADRHLVVEKQHGSERTTTALRELSDESEREAEVARLIGASGEDAAEVSRLVRAGAAEAKVSV